MILEFLSILILTANGRDLKPDGGHFLVDIFHASHTLSHGQEYSFQ